MPSLDQPAQDIRDIRGPLPLPEATDFGPYLLAGLATVAAFALALLAWRLYRRHKLVKRAPHEVALAQLAAARQHMSPERAEAFTTAVSAAVRRYIEAAFPVPASPRTTEELLVVLANDAAGPLSPYRVELGEFLAACDMAKYARWSPMPGELQLISDRATAFVRATAPGGSA